MSSLLNYFLKNYQNLSYKEAQKVRFLASICLVVFILVFFYNMIVLGFTDKSFTSASVMVTNIALLLIFGILALIRLGYIDLASHCFVTMAFVCIWSIYILEVNTETPVQLMNSINYIFPFLCFAIILLSKKWIIAYSMLNIFLSIAVGNYFQSIQFISTN
ncbi:MAG: hypothetical protein AAF518_28865, partial [Spirochaetota bacterium]